MKKTYIFFCFTSLFFLSSCTNNENESQWGFKLQKVDNYIIENNDNRTKIAILDSGINKKHLPKDIITKDYNVITNEKKTNDKFNHGTKVASIIIDEQIGINNNVEIFDIQVINEIGQTTIKNVCDGISKAIEYKAEIINMSLGFNSNSKELESCIDKALKKNIIIVASAGDTMSNNSDYPAEYKNVISVAAIDEEKELFDFSSTGKIDFYAPGVDITVKDNQGNYIKSEGSSIASANFTGVLSMYINKKVNTKETFSDKNLVFSKNGSTVVKVLTFNKK